MANACSGRTLSASSGVAAMPTPEKPPLARPTSSTAMKATARNRGSVNTERFAFAAGGHVRAKRSPAGQCWLRMAGLPRRRAFSKRARWTTICRDSKPPGGINERHRNACEEVRLIRRVLSVLSLRTLRPHLPPATLRRLDAGVIVSRCADRHPQSRVAARRARLRLRFCLDRAFRVREEPARIVQAAALQFPG